MTVGSLVKDHRVLGIVGVVDALTFVAGIGSGAAVVAEAVVCARTIPSSLRSPVFVF